MDESDSQPGTQREGQDWRTNSKQIGSTAMHDWNITMRTPGCRCKQVEHTLAVGRMLLYITSRMTMSELMHSLVVRVTGRCSMGQRVVTWQWHVG